MSKLTAALEALGYVAVRWDAEMLRPDMHDLPAVVLADGYHLRAPEAAELPAVHQMMVEGFAEHWGEHEAEDQRIEDWLDDPRFRRDLVVVAWAGARPASARVQHHRDGSGRDSPGAARRGRDPSRPSPPGPRARRHRPQPRAPARRGATSAYLGVDTDNHNRALALYEACGFRVASTSTTYRKPMPGTEDRP